MSYTHTHIHISRQQHNCILIFNSYNEIYHCKLKGKKHHIFHKFMVQCEQEDIGGRTGLSHASHV